MIKPDATIEVNAESNKISASQINFTVKFLLLERNAKKEM
jgi:hypothetical protein